MPPLLQRHHINAAIYLGVSLLSKGVSILLIPLYTGRLSRAQYGVYGLCQTIYWIVPYLVSLALGSAVARFYFDYQDPDRRDRMVGGVAATLIAMCLGWGLLAEMALLLAPGLRLPDLTPAQQQCVLWTSVLIPVNEIPGFYYRAAEKALRYSVFQLSVFATTAGTTVYLMVGRNAGLDGLLGGMLAGQLLGAGFTVAFVAAALRPAFERRVLLDAIHYSLPFVPHMIGNALMVGADRWALKYYHLEDDLGLYTLATTLTMAIPLATSAWNESSSPRYLAVWRDGGDRAARLALPRLVAGFALCGGSALAATVVGLPVLRAMHFVKPSYYPALPLVPWIGVSLVVASFFSAFVNVLSLHKTTRIIPVLTLCSVAVNVLLNFVLVPRYGVWGAILATGLAYLFRSTILMVFALRALRYKTDSS